MNMVRREGSRSRWIRAFVYIAVSGCGLMPAQAKEPLKTEMTVKLPPFVVEQTGGAKWRYGEIPGCEILARCDDATTERTVLAFHRANQLLSLILPDRFQIKTEATKTLILYDEKLWPLAKREAFANMLLSNPSLALEESVESAIHQGSVRKNLSPGTQLLASESPTRTPSPSFFNNLQLSDADSMAIFAMVSDARIDPWDTILTPAYVGNVVNARSPSFPAWFRCGFLGIYTALKYKDNTLAGRSSGWEERKHSYAEDRSNVAGQIIPLGDFLGMSAQGEGPKPPLWAAEAELFVSWGMDPDDSNRVDGFWDFVEHCCTHPATESFFRKCFGLGFAEATSQMAAYRTHIMRWNLDKKLGEIPPLQLRDAAPGEIARIKGEWERLETRYVRKNLPDLEDTYVRQARRTLLRAFDQGDRDSRLLATLGLLELDAHNKTSARIYLEDAVNQSVIRPRAYFELAQLRYDELLARSTRNDRKLGAAQADLILAPLVAVHRQAPPLPQVYELMADVCINCAIPPDSRVMTALEEGVKLFPADNELVSRMAILQSRTEKSSGAPR